MEDAPTYAQNSIESGSAAPPPQKPPPPRPINIINPIIMPTTITGPTAIALRSGRAFVFAWLLQRRADAPDVVTIDSKPLLSLIQNAADYAEALRRSRTSLADEWPEYELVSHTCFELLQTEQ